MTIKQILRQKYQLPTDAFICGSFQRDTEGASLANNVYLPKLEKGVDLLADFFEKTWDTRKDLHILLAGWRRQYIIKRLENANIPYTYFELPSQEVINELYQTLDLYPVTARHEGGPQSLIECGLLNVPVVSRPVGIAEQVLPPEAINEDVTLARPRVPDVSRMLLPGGYEPYRTLIESL